MSPRSAVPFRILIAVSTKFAVESARNAVGTMASNICKNVRKLTKNGATLNGIRRASIPVYFFICNSILFFDIFDLNLLKK